MSVDLYHFEPNANGGKPLIALIEKGVTFTSHWVDLLNWGQHQPDYLAINPKGQVPTLIHDGIIITESTPMCEYIDEAFDGPSLRPADAAGRAHMRRWCRYADEFLGPSLSMVAWNRFIGPMMRQRSREELEAAVAAIPTKERIKAWTKTIENDFPDEELAESQRRIAVAAERIDAQLGETPWLAGSTYSLADIVVFNMAAGLPTFMPDRINGDATPHLLTWIERVGSRAAVREALAYSRNSLRPIKK
jgi:GST-like protein